MPYADKIPVSVLVMTRNEESRIARCLEALQVFDEIVVVDSGSADKTASIARDAGARVENFVWDKGYPKKRQWSLDNLPLHHDWVFFVDADEVVPAALAEEIRVVRENCAGYFVKGRYVMGQKILKHGLCNNKIAFFNRYMMMFPVVDDLDLPGMGEIEGHYQPVLRPEYKDKTISRLKAPLFHYAHDDSVGWMERHHRYADWESGMNARNAWPADPVPWRQMLKKVFRALPGRPVLAFIHCYIFKFGFLDQKPGWDFARSRALYYTMIKKSR